MSPPPLRGTVAPGFEAVREAFADLLWSGEETGAGLAVHQQGRFVVDLMGGWADAERTRPWAPNTLVHTYSVSKPFAALAALTCVASGHLSLDEPLSRCWPAYATKGKDTTLRHALSHRAAQPAFPDGLSTRDLYDAEGLERALAIAPAEWTPGAAPAEHALTYGHLLSGAVRSATGRGFGEVFARQVAAPLGLDAHFGVPVEDLWRVAELELSDPEWPVKVCGTSGSLRWRSLSRPPGAVDVSVLNGRAWRTCVFPAIGLHATATSIAAYYSRLLSDTGPVRQLLGPELYAEFVTPAVTGHDRLLEREVTWTLGMQVDDDGLGMAGIGGCDAYADTRHGFGYAYLTRRLADHSRSERVLAALEEAL